ncbi:DUF1707 SHOCT-like domain-containing protein [Microlunatus speluncae]|uniref:DUF1707 SHOCT-like domain-containing protein n=1 Tax=Microlunatus speluncae TaxID=2594267 RepID=UPI0012660733|nr:DUF1707 domain-containing protein [Microlunatus speluncae]
MTDQRPEVPAVSVEQAREVCLDLVQQHYALGDLSQEDLDDRVGLALQAKNHRTLFALTSDLPLLPPATSPKPPVVAGPIGRGRRLTYAIVGAVAVVVAGLGGVVALGGIRASADQPADYFYCEATGSEDPAQTCPAVSASRLRLDSYADQIHSYRSQIEEYVPSNELLARVESAAQLADMAQERARVEALVEATGGKPDTAAVEKLTGQVETAMRDAAAALSEAIANGPR